MKYAIIYILTLATLCAATYDPKQERITYLTILGESRNQGFDGMRAVAQVLLNRSKDRGLKVDQVCLQRYQFSCWQNPDFDAWTDHNESTELAKSLAAFICAGVDVGADLVGSSTHYYAHDIVFPYWAKDCTDPIIIKDHTFLTCK